MDIASFALLVSAATFILNIVVHIGTGTWRISAALQETTEKLAQRIDSDNRIFGETLLALRQKINDVELKTSETYVRRDSWHQAVNQLHSQLSAIEKANDERAIRLEHKIDRLVEKLAQVTVRENE